MSAAQLVEQRSGFRELFLFPDGDECVQLQSRDGMLWAQAARPDGSTYWIDLTTILPGAVVN